MDERADDPDHSDVIGSFAFAGYDVALTLHPEARMTWRRTRESGRGSPILLAFLSAAVVACATHSSPVTNPTDPSIISSTEIDSARQTTAYDLIRKLRPSSC